jgi:hypothetical protein
MSLEDFNVAENHLLDSGRVGSNSSLSSRSRSRSIAAASSGSKRSKTSKRVLTARYLLGSRPCFDDLSEGIVYGISD